MKRFGVAATMLGAVLMLVTPMVVGAVGSTGGAPNKRSVELGAARTFRYRVAVAPSGSWEGVLADASGARTKPRSRATKEERRGRA